MGCTPSRGSVVPSETVRRPINGHASTSGRHTTAAPNPQSGSYSRAQYDNQTNPRNSRQAASGRNPQTSTNDRGRNMDSANSSERRDTANDDDDDDEDDEAEKILKGLIALKLMSLLIRPPSPPPPPLLLIPMRGVGTPPSRSNNLQITEIDD